MDGNTLGFFNQSTLTNGLKTKKKLKKSRNDLTNHVFPKRAAQTKKRFMQTFLNKPVSMKKRSYVSHVIKLNSIFGQFPQTTHYLEVLELDEDELLDLLEYGIPLH